MSDEGEESREKRAAAAAPSKREREDGETARIEKYEPVSWTARVSRLLGRAEVALTPEALKILAKNLKHVTDTRTRTSLFALCFWLGVAFSAAALGVAAACGAMLGIPFAATIIVFCGFWSAMVVSNIPALRQRFTTPERKAIEELDENMNDAYAAIDEYARRRSDSGASKNAIEAEVAVRQKQVLDEHLKELRIISRNRKTPQKALPPPRPDQEPTLK